MVSIKSLDGWRCENQQHAMVHYAVYLRCSKAAVGCGRRTSVVLSFLGYDCADGAR